MVITFKIKKFIAFAVTALLPVLGTLFAQMTANTIILYATLPVMLGVSYFFYVIMLRNPFHTMLEGKGMLAVNIDSRGLFQFFNVGVFPPNIKGKFGGRIIEDVWDRNVSVNFVPPVENQGYAKIDNDGNWTIKVTNDEYNKSKMAYMQYPLLLYNSQINSLITKEYLSGTENRSFANHPILRLNHLVNDLNFNLRNFGRYLVDQLQPDKPFFKTPMGIAIIVIVIVLAIIMLMKAPALMAGVQSSLGGAASTVANPVATIVPT